MLIAYHRGRLPIEHGITTGLMAATGLSAAEAVERCSGTNVVMACDNSPTSTTISGMFQYLLGSLSCTRRLGSLALTAARKFFWRHDNIYDFKRVELRRAFF